MATIPSIAMIPSGYKASKVYSVLPTDGTGDLTFSRAGALPSFNATRVNSDGLIEEVLSNVPRLDYSDGGCPSLLIEPESRNLLTYSEDFSDVSWGKISGEVTVDSNFAIAPNGNLTADKINFISGFTRLSKSLSVTENTTYTLSFWVKNINATAVSIIISNTNLSTVTSYFNQINTTSFTRVSFTFTTNAGVTSISPQLTRNGNIGGSILLWGAQLEALPYATSYIPTVASTVTRVAETVSKTGLSSYINSSEGVLFFELKTFILSNGSASRRLGISDGTISNFLRLVFESTANLVAYSFFAGGVNQGGTTVALPNNTTDFNKYALVWASNRLELWFNGVRLGNDAVATMPSANTFSRLALNDFNNANNFEGEIKNLQVYPTALSDLEIETITSYTSFEEMALALDYTIEITL